MEKRATNRRKWRLLTENVVRKWKTKSLSTHPDDNEKEKKNKMQFDPTLVSGQLLF